jgi:hypothetical protein
VTDLGEYDIGVILMRDELDRPFIIENVGLDDQIITYLNSDGSLLEEIMEYVSDGEPVFMSSVASISDRAKVWGIESLTILPIQISQEMVAVMFFASTETTEIPMSDRHLMISIWYQVRETIKAIRLRQQHSEQTASGIEFRTHHHYF